VRGLASVAAMLPMDEAQAALAHLAGPAIATIQRAAAPQVCLPSPHSPLPSPLLQGRNDGEGQWELWRSPQLQHCVALF